MRLEGIAIGDIVLADIKGRQFHAEVVGKANGRQELEVQPLERGITWRHVGARDIADHWRKRRRGPYNPRARSRPRAVTPPLFSEQVAP